MERFDQKDVDVARSTGCQCVASVEDQTVVEVAPAMSPVATDRPPVVTTVLMAPSGSSPSRRRQTRAPHAADTGGGAVKATGSGCAGCVGWAVVGPAEAIMVADAAEGLAAASPGSVGAASPPVSPHGLEMASTIPTTTTMTATIGSLSRPPRAIGCAVEGSAVSHVGSPTASR